LIQFLKQRLISARLQQELFDRGNFRVIAAEIRCVRFIFSTNFALIILETQERAVIRIAMRVQAKASQSLDELSQG